MALCERFGWTWDELDEQDMTRIFPAVAAANIRDALARVRQWADLAAAGRKPPHPSDADMRIWSAAQKAKQHA